jgi:hypothetical protein
MEIAETIISQYGAALRMLRSAIEACPDELWESDSYENRFWHIAYHVLFYTHLYLSASESAFVPWEKSKPWYQFMGPLPWPPHDKPKIGEPYTRSAILEYWEWLGERVPTHVREVPFDDPSGFPWLPFKRFELHLYNIRHIQHHAGQLIERLRGEGMTDFGWVRTGEEDP